jgi:hypothetical protein
MPFCGFRRGLSVGEGEPQTSLTEWLIPDFQLQARGVL